MRSKEINNYFEIPINSSSSPKSLSNVTWKVAINLQFVTTEFIFLPLKLTFTLPQKYFVTLSCATFFCIVNEKVWPQGSREGGKKSHKKIIITFSLSLSLKSGKRTRRKKQFSKIKFVVEWETFIAPTKRSIWLNEKVWE